MKKMLCLVVLVLGVTVNALAAERFKIAWSHYTGWEPWEYARHAGILEKWAKKYNIKIELSKPLDYVQSINQFTSGVYHGCVMTNMDALINPAVGGIDCTLLIPGDTSHGNDGIVTKSEEKISQLKGKQVTLVIYTVSHYLLSRALSMNSLKESEVKLLNITDESKIAGVFASDPKSIMVTWNPILMEIRNMKGSKMIFDSSQIPGEIMDLMVVRTGVPDSLKRALVGTWFETLSIMQKRDQSGKNAIAYMAKFAGGTVAEFEAQLKTTAMFYTPSDAVAFATNEKLKKTMDYVRSFAFERGLLKGSTKDGIGIQFPDGSTMGDPKNLKIRFDANYLKLAADGKL